MVGLLGEQVIKWIPYMYLVGGVVYLLVLGEIRSIGSSGKGRALYLGRAGTVKVLTDLTALVLGFTLLLSLDSVIRASIVGFTLLVIGISRGVLQERVARIEDFEYGLVVSLSIVGLGLMVTAEDLVMMYLAIETMSLSLYILAGFRKTGQYSTEAGLKYIVLGALSSGIILIGISQIYVHTGTVDFGGISMYSTLSGESSMGLVLGFLFVVAALMFKLGVAPLHMWVPDVYEGAPTIVTMFFAIVPKLGVVSLLMTILSNFENIEAFKTLAMGVGILSIVVGSLGAINQTKIKRVLAYSAIAHMGWVLLGLGVGSQAGFEAAIVYMILYMVVGLTRFGVVTKVYEARGNNYLVELSGLARRAPVLALTLSMALLSTAGIPPLAGFFSKYYLLISMLEEGWLIASIVAIVSSVIGAFYYVRIIQLMYFNDAPSYLVKEIIDTASPSVKTLKINNMDSWAYGIMGGALFIITTFLLFPHSILMIAHL